MTPEELFNKIEHVDRQSAEMMRDLVVTEVLTAEAMIEVAKTEFAAGETGHALRVAEKATLAHDTGMKWLERLENKGFGGVDLRQSLAKVQAALQRLPAGPAK
ncbi:MAG: hypothetical protein ABI759_20805 [Candidatus Solibacter sp.]